MSKIITMPFTCKQFLWVLIPVLHILFAISIVYREPAAIFVTFIPVLIFWEIKIILWGVLGKFPTFRCKCDD